MQVLVDLRQSAVHLRIPPLVDEADEPTVVVYVGVGLVAGLKNHLFHLFRRAGFVDLDLVLEAALDDLGDRQRSLVLHLLHLSVRDVLLFLFLFLDLIIDDYILKKLLVLATLDDGLRRDCLIVLDVRVEHYREVIELVVHLLLQHLELQLLLVRLLALRCLNLIICHLLSADDQWLFSL